MERTSDDAQDDTASQDAIVNYLPGMPKLSSDPGRIERFLGKLLERRGELRPVVRRRDETPVRSRDQ